MTHSTDTLLAAVRAQAAEVLRPLVPAIDVDGVYPEDYLRALGAVGGFAALASADDGGAGLGLAAQIDVLAAVGTECGATAFMGWCQTAFAWYLRQTRNAALRQRLLPDVLAGRRLAGTGMSNTVKHLAGIEKHLLKAERDDAGGGWIVGGALPWVSNLADDPLFACTAQTPDGGHVMLVASGRTRGLTLKRTPEFCALEGTRTLALQFDRAFVADADVLAAPAEFPAYLARIKPGFVLLQVGIALGVVEGCLKILRESDLVNRHVNAYLDDTHEVLQQETHALRARTHALAAQAEAGRAAPLAVLRLRLDASLLALRAAQSAVLHAGARGYLMRHPAQRRQREANFVAIVTPAVKHLRLEIDALERAAAQAEADAAVTSSAAAFDLPPTRAASFA